MKNRLIYVSLMLVLALVLAACGSQTTGNAGDPQAAQSYLPTLTGYTVTQADSISDALSSVVEQGADAIANPVLEQVITRIDTFVECYGDVGAVAANIYTQIDLGSLISGNIPSAGAVAVVNQDRVRENLLACAAQTAGGDFQAASAPTVCTGNATFTDGGDTLTYIYIGSSENFCNAVVAHFGQYGS